MKKALSSFGIIVAVIAVVIGTVAKVSPHLFFKVPNVGFIFWAITGGIMPPYITSDMYQEGKTDWLKKGDVVVTTGAKAGTTWMLFCSHQIRVKGNDEKFPYIDTSVSTPWPGLVEVPGDTWEDKWNKLNTAKLSDGTLLKQYWDHPDYPFRIFKSHDMPEAYGSLVGGDKVKFLAMARNGLDTVASATPFFAQHSDEFRNLWGGFPPLGKSDPTEEAKVRMDQMSPGGMFEGWHFGYINNWWKVKDEKNVLLLHYSDAKKDLSRTVSKMADFYGVKLTSNEKKAVVEKCSFSYMKKNTHMFNYLLPLNPAFEGTIMSHGSMTRKGKDGDGKNIFSDEDKAKWAKLEEESFGDDPIKLNWARNGGDTEE